MGGADACPCGSGRALVACCGRYLAGEAPPTAEALMRSRYTAFAVGDEDHLLRTWHVETRPPAVRFVPGQRWVRLDVLATVAGDLLDTEGAVEFRAHHERHGVGGVLHELSRFVRDAEHRWVYVGPLEARAG
jgi:SEC-C motif-containing protein